MVRYDQITTFADSLGERCRLPIPTRHLTVHCRLCGEPSHSTHTCFDHTQDGIGRSLSSSIVSSP